MKLWSININLTLLMATVEFVWWGHSNFRVQPNYSVEVMLCCLVIGVVTNVGYR